MGVGRASSTRVSIASSPGTGNKGYFNTLPLIDATPLGKEAFFLWLVKLRHILGLV